MLTLLIVFVAGVLAGAVAAALVYHNNQRAATAAVAAAEADVASLVAKARAAGITLP